MPRRERKEDDIIHETSTIYGRIYIYIYKDGKEKMYFLSIAATIRAVDTVDSWYDGLFAK